MVNFVVMFKSVITCVVVLPTRLTQLTSFMDDVQDFGCDLLKKTKTNITINAANLTFVM